MKFTSVPTKVGVLLSTGFYKVPRFQRPYSWRREELEEFWTDAVASDDSDYFIGSIVTYSESDGAHGIVDGQQRLTTLTILFCCIRNAFAREGHTKLADGLHGKTIERPNVDGVPECILQPETSHPFFIEHIQSRTPPKTKPEVGIEEEDLRAAHEYLQNQLETSIAGLRSDPSLSATKRKNAVKKKLEELRDKLLSLSLILVGLDREDDAYLLFETLNARGKDLRVSDLVKNHLARLLKKSTKTLDIVKERWKTVVETMEGSGATIEVDNLIHHHWLSSHDYTSEKKLFKAIKKSVDKASATAYLDELVRESPIYRSIFEPLTATWDKNEIAIREALYGLTVFGVRQPSPLLLALLVQLKNGVLKASQVAKAIGAIETFHFKFTAIASQSSSGGISQMYAKHAREVREAGSSQIAMASIQALKVKLKERIPAEDEFDAGFVQLAYSEEYTRDRHLVRYILGRITRAKLGIENLDFRQSTLEHLAPQSSIGLGIESVASIGNLLVVSDKLNEKLGAKSFAVKKPLLKKANGIWRDEILEAATSWSGTEIDARARLLSKVAREEVWKI